MLNKQIAYGVALVASVTSAAKSCNASDAHCNDPHTKTIDEYSFSWQEVMKRPEAQQMAEENNDYDVDQEISKPYRAYCFMQKNPVYPTSNPYGWVQLFQFVYGSPLYIWGNIYQLPGPHGDEHAFAINQNAWNRKDCASAGPHFQAVGETHGAMNGSWSHSGALTPLNDVGGTASFFMASIKAQLHGSSFQTVYGRTMTVYERGDDLGTQDTYASQWYGSSCKEIACCQISKFLIIDYPDDDQFDDKGRRLDALEELEDDVEYLSPEEFRQLFGYDHTEEPFFDQN